MRSTWFTVIGVLPPTFTGTAPAVPDFWVHSSMREALREGLGDRHSISALLRPGVPPERAGAALSAAARRLQRDRRDVVDRVDVRPHTTYLSAHADELQLVAPALFATFLLVLLIASANLANLFLARMAARRPEIATRFSVGAGRARIVRQLLTEATLLGLAGAALGLLMAAAGAPQLQAWLFSIATDAGVTVLPLSPDWRLFAYAAVLGMVAGGLFGALPALDAVDLVRKRRGRLRSSLLAGQVGASLVLLILAGLLVRNIQRLAAVQPGFDLEHTFTLKMDPPTAAVIDHLRTRSGVEGIAVVSQSPLMGQPRRYDARVGEVVARASTMHVDDHYFATTDLRLTSGRTFTAAEATTRARVAIVSASTARTLWPGGAAVGRVLTIPADEDNEPAWHGTFEVIGVAPDVINGFIFQGPERIMVYLPGAVGQDGMVSALIRLTDARGASLEAIRQACGRVPGSTGCTLSSLADVVAMQRFPFQAAAAVAGALGLTALLLTALGLYSVVSYSIERRRREIGVMVAIGAEPKHVLRRILDEPARCLAWGLGLGLPCCLGLFVPGSGLSAERGDVRCRRLRRRVGPAGAIAALACVLPVSRALRVQPERGAATGLAVAAFGVPADRVIWGLRRSCSCAGAPRSSPSARTRTVACALDMVASRRQSSDAVIDGPRVCPVDRFTEMSERRQPEPGVGQRHPVDDGQDPLPQVAIVTREREQLPPCGEVAAIEDL